MDGVKEGAARRHLGVLAREPRPAGGEAEARARDYAERVLEEAGFTVRRERFAYSRFPGRFATPIGGALVAAIILVAATLGLLGAPAAALAVLLLGAQAAAAFASAMLGDAVLDLPIHRAGSENLVATWGSERPRVWLVAHLDSKSQPVPSLLRVAGVVVLLVALLVALAAGGMQLASYPHRMMWWVAAALALLGAVPVVGSLVGARSNGAVDNASGVAVVLAAATSIGTDSIFGVLLPSAEEMGLAGARAWARRAERGTALNCDGVDDAGEITIMYSGAAPRLLVDTLTALATRRPRVRRLPLGLLTDAVALADRGWSTVTVSRGSLATLRRVHTPADSLDNLRGDGLDEVAQLLARTVEALA